ncbi:MAG: hypothetical protein U5K37_05430 [Natrialbaceae archaeon]|nr:hypothetical protein [Natrialbaceae archaeon]
MTMQSGLGPVTDPDQALLAVGGTALGETNGSGTGLFVAGDVGPQVLVTAIGACRPNRSRSRRPALPPANSSWWSSGVMARGRSGPSSGYSSRFPSNVSMGPPI